MSAWSRIEAAAFRPRSHREQRRWLVALSRYAARLWPGSLPDTTPRPNEVTDGAGERWFQPSPRGRAFDPRVEGFRVAREDRLGFSYRIHVAGNTQPARWTVYLRYDSILARIDYDTGYAEPEAGRTPAGGRAAGTPAEPDIDALLLAKLFHPTLHFHWNIRRCRKARFLTGDSNPWLTLMQAVIQLTPPPEAKARRPSAGLRPQDGPEFRRLREVLASTGRGGIPPADLFGLR